MAAVRTEVCSVWGGVQVSLARPSSDLIKGANLYVGGIPKTWTQAELDRLFSPFGNIVTSRILCDQQTGNSEFWFLFHSFILHLRNRHFYDFLVSPCILLVLLLLLSLYC